MNPIDKSLMVACFSLEKLTISDPSENTESTPFATTEDQSMDCEQLTDTQKKSPNFVDDYLQLRKQDVIALSKIFYCLTELQITFPVFSIEDVSFIVDYIINERGGSLSHYFRDTSNRLCPRRLLIICDPQTKNSLTDISQIKAYCYVGNFINYCEGEYFNIVEATDVQIQKMILDFNNSPNCYSNIENQVNYLHRLRKIMYNPRYKELFKEIIRFNYKNEIFLFIDLNNDYEYLLFFNRVFIENSCIPRNLELLSYLEENEAVPTLEQCMPFITKLY